MIDRETALELQGLLEEADFWVRETKPSEWRIFSRVYDTRGSFLAASKKVQGRIAKALALADSALHHIDGDPTNNAPENLRVVNRRDNR